MRSWLIVCFAFLYIGIVIPKASATDFRSVLFFWGPINDRVLSMAEVELSPETGIIDSIKLYDNLGPRRPSYADYSETARLVGENKLIRRTDNSLEYALMDSKGEGVLRFEWQDGFLLASGYGLDRPRKIFIDSDSLGYLVYTEGGLAYGLRAENSSIKLIAGEFETLYVYRDGTLRTISQQYTGLKARTAMVELEADNYAIVEMPPYGDPGEFSHRIEIWADALFQGTLTSAAINSYLLPSSELHFIFPFFAPTPQEILEQAAAAQ